jgi:hypothetical protein
MAFYLRALNNKQRWHKSNNPSWLPENDIPVHPLADLLPKLVGDHTLSLWYVEPDRSNLKRVAAAITAGRDRIDKFDFALFPEEVIGSSGVSVIQIPGETPDDASNNQWHWDVVELTAEKLVRLAKAMYLKGEVARILPGDVRKLINDGVNSGQLQESKISQHILEELKA